MGDKNQSIPDREERKKGWGRGMGKRCQPLRVKGLKFQ